MQYKPIVVINEYPPEIEYFDNIRLAEKHVRQWGGQIYRHNDWYQYLQAWIKILIGRVYVDENNLEISIDHSGTN